MNYVNKQYAFANSLNRLLTDGDQLVKGNLQTFICIAKDTMARMGSNPSLTQSTFAKIEKTLFERNHDRPILSYKQLVLHGECDFSFSILKSLKELHESKG